MSDAVAGKMFLFKEALVQYQPMGDLDNPEAPTNHLVVVQILAEVGEPENLQASPAMFLAPDQARQLGQRLIREAKTAAEFARSDSSQKKH